MFNFQFLKFILVGIFSAMVDFFFYRSSVFFFTPPIEISKGCGFIFGTIASYYLNRFWTFSYSVHSAGNAIKFISLYTVTLGANVIINSIMLNIFKRNDFSIYISFIFSAGVSAILNFIGMKLYVFRSVSSAKF